MRITKTRSYPSLTAWRQAQGFSQHQAARALGISQSCYAKLELGRRRPRLALLQKLIRETGVPLETLVQVTL